MKPVNYQKLCPQGTPKEIRRKFDIGDIFKNKAKCLQCGKIITSKNRHDFVTCKCGNLSVDGGSWYIRRCFTSEDSFKELSVSYDDIPKSKSVQKRIAAQKGEK